MRTDTRRKALEALFHAIQRAGGIFSWSLLRPAARETFAGGWRGVVAEMVSARSAEGQSPEEILEAINEALRDSTTPRAFADKLEATSAPDLLSRPPAITGSDAIGRHLDELCATWERYKSAAMPQAERLEVGKEVAAAIRRLGGLERLEANRSGLRWLIGRRGESHRARSSRALAWAYAEAEDPTLFPAAAGRVCVERQEIGPAFDLTDERLRQLLRELEAAKFPTPSDRAAAA